jgi:hypothetical protein
MTIDVYGTRITFLRQNHTYIIRIVNTKCSLHEYGNFFKMIIFFLSFVFKRSRQILMKKNKTALTEKQIFEYLLFKSCVE